MSRKSILIAAVLIFAASSNAQSAVLAEILKVMAIEAAKGASGEAGKSAVDYFKKIFNKDATLAKEKEAPQLREEGIDGKVRKWVLSPAGTLTKSEIDEIARTLKTLDHGRGQRITITINNRVEEIANTEVNNQGGVLINNVSGNVVFSQNQSGGITAHSVNVNQPLIPEWTLGQSEKTSTGEWRAKLRARGVGNLAYYNWNILFTLNTQVIRREDVPGEVTVGPWMPLSVTGGSLQPNHFFIGFSEFKPGQAFSIYLYTKEPIKVLKVDVLSQ